MERFTRRSSAESPNNRLGRAFNMAIRRLSPVRNEGATLNTDAEFEEDVKGPLGLNLLHTVAEPLIDFIFVHGLGGGSRKTWSMSSNPHHYWPKEWLSRDPEFRFVRIHSFGYKADWGEKGESILNIHDFARSLLSEIHCSPDIRRSDTKIVLVAHSMGGIVIKKAYMLAREDPDLKSLTSRIHSLYFLATPHRGSEWGQLAKVLLNILKASNGSKPFATELDCNSESIASINDSFRHFVDDIRLWSFYETIPSNLMFTKAIIVNKASATLGYAKERSSLLNANHHSICKFDQETNPNYQALRNAFITTIDSISSEIYRTTSEPSNLEHHRLIELTGVTDPQVDELSSLEDIRSPGSCQWLTSKAGYDSWRTAQPGSRSIFWLTGDAGSGKSVLCGPVIRDLDEHKLGCSYFFFKQGIASNSTVAGCLRALAYQMAKSNDAVLRRVLEVQRDAPLLEQWDEKTVWRKLFVGCIFKETQSMPLFWVIDALDECQNFPAFLPLIAQAPSYVRLFLTSRKTPEIDKGLAKLAKVVGHYQIQEEDTHDDINIFIESRIDHLPASDDNYREKLKNKILRKASGSFLWVSLVVRELEQAYSEEGAEEVLNEVPTDMNKVYARMLENVLKNPRAAALARSIFMWTLLSLRPLKANELQFAIKLDTNQTVHDLDKSASAICGQLVRVNQKSEVEIIHQTAITYLLQQEDHPSLALNKQQSHSQIARICLTVLWENFSKGAHPRPMKAASYAKFIEYACKYFSDHLQRGSSEDSTAWDLLWKFLDYNVSLWIEHLARSKNLHHITRTAKNLQAYLKRRVKYLSPLSHQNENLESWINDLIRLNAKFGTSLDISPSSIHSLVPAMCPSESIISKTYISRKARLLINGLSNIVWDDCLARIDYLNHQANSIAHGDQLSAVAISDGTVFLYYQDSIQAKSTLGHGERVKIMAFSSEDRYLASSGLRSVKVWDPAEGTLVWKFDTSHQPLAFIFLDNDNVLATATQGNYMVAWDLREGAEMEQWKWTKAYCRATGQQKPHQPPGKALFSPDATILAVSYRGLPIYLFDVNNKKFIGHCSRTRGMTNHYYVDALAFNPSPEIDILVVSYGDGELVVYDVGSTELRYRSSNIFAHNLACSPDGRKLVAGSSRGNIEIFEFAGARRETLSLTYRINAYEDGIRGIAFSSNSLRFSDIRGSQYRVWEPAVLVCNGQDEGSQSEFSQAITLEPKLVGMHEEPQAAEITAICCDHTGDFVFCGKQDGSVAYFETTASTQRGVLYRHATKVGVTCIAYIDERTLLITADESGRVLINNITRSPAGCELIARVAEIRSEESVTELIPDTFGTRVLLRGKMSAEVWTTEGKKVGGSIPLHNDECKIINHPVHTEQFISVGRMGVSVYSWANALKIRPIIDDKKRTISLTVTPSSPGQHSEFLPEDLANLYSYQKSSQFVVSLANGSPTSTSSSSVGSLQVWPASSISVSDPCPRPLPIPGFDNLTNKVRQIICVTGSLILFLDVSLWVCSLDVTKVTSFSHKVKRHFFLLSEWQSSNRGFIIDYVPVTREFVVAKKDRILIVSKGLELEEPWLAR